MTVAKQVEISEMYGRPTYAAFNPAHQPYNMKSWEFHSATAKLSIADYNGRKPNANPESWMELQLTEFVTPWKGKTREPGRAYERTISMTLDPAARRALIEYLQAEEARDWSAAAA